MTSDQDRIQRALEIAEFGYVEDAPRKAYVIDQMVRALLGPEAYLTWVSAFEAGEDGPKTYQWHTGAPFLLEQDDQHKAAD